MKRATLFCLALLAAPASGAEPLGRLFYTAEQRAQLDRLRAHPPAARPTTETVREAPPAARTVTYSGMVRRSDGRYTAWINDHPVHDRANDAGLPHTRVNADGSASVDIPHEGSVRLKVGQTAELATGRVEETYARPAPPARVMEAAPPRVEPALRLRRRYDTERDLPPDERAR